MKIHDIQAKNTHDADVDWCVLPVQMALLYTRGDSAAQHWNRKLNLTNLCIKHIVEYSVTFITVKERVCINLNALKRSEHFPLFLCLRVGVCVCIIIKQLYFGNTTGLNMRT